MIKPGLPVLLALAALVSGPARSQTKLDTTQFVVVGEGLAAGMADFGLREVYQDKSFGAQMARQMKTAFPQPLIEGAGIGTAPGFPELPTRSPGTLQGSVRTPFPPYLFIFNLSIPGQRLADALTRRPSPPVVQQRDVQQTVANLILGYPALIAGKDKPLWSQVEYAMQMMPSFLIVELGYFDVLDPAVKDDPGLLPDVATFRTNLTTVISRLKTTNAEMLVMTIPDPFDTAYFTPLAGVSRLVGPSPDTLVSLFKVRADDMLTPSGLMRVGNRLHSRNFTSLPNPLGSTYPGSVVSGATRTAVRARVTALNAEIATAAKAVGANVYDLAGLFTRIRAQGLLVGTIRLTADFLGGFYSLDGYYPGSVGHGVIANEVLALLNQTYKTSFPLLDLVKIGADDPAGRFRPASVRNPVTKEELQ